MGMIYIEIPSIMGVFYNLIYPSIWAFFPTVDLDIENGPLPLQSTGRHVHFLNSACDIELSDMRHEGYKCSDMRRRLFINPTCDNKETKRQRHVTLPFLEVTQQAA